MPTFIPMIGRTAALKITTLEYALKRKLDSYIIHNSGFLLQNSVRVPSEESDPHSCLRTGMLRLRAAVVKVGCSEPPERAGRKNSSAPLLYSCALLLEIDCVLILMS